MKKLYTTLFAGAAMLMATSAFAQAPEALYMIGDGPGWTPGAPLEATSSEGGVFVFEGVTLTGSPAYFSFINTVNDDWGVINDGEHRYGPAEGTDAVIVSPVETEFALGGDTSWNTEGGTYTFTMDFNDMTLSVVAYDGEVEPGPGPVIPDDNAQTVYLIGGPNGWTPDMGMEMTYVQPGIYMIEDVEFTADSQYFAFATQLGENSDDWSTLNAHRLAPEEKDAEFSLTDPNPFVYGIDASWQIQPGVYTLYVNLNTNFAATSLEAGVKAVGVDVNGNEVIYNLNGVKVSKDNLAPGIYIINGKKTLVK